jgi:ABC-type branched-subunit amino acid transport system substrate-binding protein
VRAADSLASLAPDRDRDRALSEWAKGADLAELLFVLRRPAATLGGSEAPLLEAALARAPGARAALRQRLALRLAAADRARAGSAWRSLAGVTLLPMFARASAHRVAVLLPDSGEYVAEARALRSGLAAGLAPTAARLPVEIMDLATGDDSPDRVAGAFVRAAEVCAVIVGGLQPPSTAALATAARATGLPLIAPGAGGDALGSIGPGVFQVGPSGLQRGRVLARAVLASGARRVGVLSAGESPLVEGFAAEVAVLKAATYAPGTPDLSREIREFKSLGVDLLLWDGEARDAETLLRQLAQEKWSVPICGGAELDPERHHAQIRPLLEGVTFVGEDWQLPASTQSVLDSMARAAGEEHAGPLVARGYLAGRLISEAVTSGALAPEELAAAFGARLVADPDLRGRGFVEWTPAEATLPVFTVTRGRAVALSRGQ